ncbi:MAG: GyrI-like domain-containing protein [Candidatus Hermodarchaeota archaeon]
MEKIDYRKTMKEFYNPPGTPVIINVPELQYLMIDGKGYPGTSQEYQDAIEALYPVAYTLRFALKKAGILDYKVMPLEGLWWAQDMDAFTIEHRKDEWLWTSMIMQPPAVTKERYQDAIEQVTKKKNPVALTKIRLETYHEGLSVQIMHIGPFSEEGPNIKKMHQYAFDQGYELHGKHHEIYLSDFRKTAPEKLRTVIRQPIKKS